MWFVITKLLLKPVWNGHQSSCRYMTHKTLAELCVNYALCHKGSQLRKKKIVAFKEERKVSKVIQNLFSFDSGTLLIILITSG